MLLMTDSYRKEWVYYYLNSRTLKNSTYFKKLCPIVGNCPEKFSYCFFHFPTWKMKKTVGKFFWTVTDSGNSYCKTTRIEMVRNN